MDFLQPVFFVTANQLTLCSDMFGTFKHIKSNVSNTVEYMLNYFVTFSFVCMDKCIVIIFCNCV